MFTFQVSAFSVHENLNFMAVGFENGVVVLFKGDVTRERSDLFINFVVILTVS